MKNLCFVSLQKELPDGSDVRVILSAMLEVVIQVIITIDHILPVTVSSQHSCFSPVYVGQSSQM